MLEATRGFAQLGCAISTSDRYPKSSRARRLRGARMSMAGFGAQAGGVHPAQHVELVGGGRATWSPGAPASLR